MASARHGRWRKGRLEPLFPGYLFVGLAEGQDGAKAESTPGFKDFLRHPDRRFIQILDKPMADLRVQAEEALRRSFGERVPQKEDWKEGDWCPVPYGPLMGKPVQIETIDKSGFVKAYLGTVPVTFHLSAISAGSPAYSVRGCA